MAESTKTELSPQAEQQKRNEEATPSGEVPGVTEGIGLVPPEEQAVRAQHQTEGGGAWPPDLLVERGTAPLQAADYGALYEQQAQESKAASKSK